MRKKVPESDQDIANTNNTSITTIQKIHARSFTLVGRWRNVFFHHLGDLIVKDDGVERPAFVRTRDLLPHGGEEARGVEEARHPERVGAAVEEPAGELLVTVQQVREPET